MINWILGGLIIAFSLYVIIRTISKVRKGKDICGCDSCDSNCSGCSPKKS